MTNYRLKNLRNLNKEELKVRRYVLNNLHKEKKKSNVVYLTVTAIVSIAMIAFMFNVFEQSLQLPKTANHGTPAIEGVNSKEVNEKIEELSTVWATALKTRDGKPRYEMMSEKAKEKFVQEQIVVSGQNWNYVIGDSSPWVVSFEIQIKGMAATITYDMQTSEASNYSKIETVHFIEDAHGEMVVDDYKSVDGSTIELNHFKLSAKEEEVYSNFQKDLNLKHLQGLEPISIAKLYVKAIFDKKYDVQYALYTDRVGYVKWSKEDDERIPKSDRGSDEQNIKQFKNIDKGKFVQTNDYEGYIEYESSEGTNSFHMIKNEDGVWQVSFMPIQ